MQSKNIFVIGPIVPFTGGIAQSNTVLCNNLSKKNSVTAISYSMMYPNFLYPGKKQTEGIGLRNSPFRQHFILNTLNPLSWIKIILMVKKQKPDWIVFQWWHTYFFPSYFFIAFFSSLFGAKINFVCHNVLPHEDNLLTILIHKPMTKLVLSLSTHILALSESELKIAKLLLPEKSSDYILENSFGSVMRGKKISKTRARKELKLPNKPVILFFGAVRPYKGLEDLISAFGLLRKNGIDAALLVAGAFWDSPEKYVSIARTLGIEKEIKIINKYIPDEEIPRLFCASDIVVLPHRTATQSAIPLLAFLYNVPIIATSVGGNSVFVDDKKTGFLVPPKDTQKLAFAMKEFFEKKLSNPFKKQMRLKGKMFEWNEKKEKIFFGEND